MRCLYCGKELALLKRLTGGGDFCSDAHKQSYQEEYNRLALSRLLQAQNKGQQSVRSAAQTAPPPPEASVVVAEPTLEPAPVLEESGIQPAVAALEVAVTEAETPVVPEVAEDAGGQEDLALSEEPEPVETAGFLLEPLAFAPWPEELPKQETPYAESWLELSSGPAMSEWQLQNGAAYTLFSADLLALELPPEPASMGDYAGPVGLPAESFAAISPAAPSSATPRASKIANRSQFPVGGATVMDVEPALADQDPDFSLVQAIAFEASVLLDDSALLELSPDDLDIPAGEAGVTELGGEDDHDTPRSSLAALSRLHQELVEHDEVTDAAEVIASPEPEPDAEPEAVAEIVEPEAQEIEAGETPKPKFTTDLFEIPIKTFQPGKAALMGGDLLTSDTPPLLPPMNSLPLRPRIALAHGYIPPASAPPLSETKQAASAASPQRAQGGSKSPSSGKPPARLIQPKQPASLAKAAQPAAKPEPRTPVPPKLVATKDATRSATKPAPPQPDAVAEASAPNVPEVASVASRTQEKSALKTAPAVTAEAPPAEVPKEDVAKPAIEAAKPKPEPAKPAPAVDQSKVDQSRVDQAKVDQSKKDTVPSFGIAQSSSSSWIGSLKVKLGLGIGILVIACTYFLGWGGAKPGKSANTNTSVLADGSGPSIIMGEGGWVEGWGGDPAGIHVGRQITIYRPSLKLSDYRLEFQGSIDANSVGWVFRASDPENYYAMKLMTVSSGLSPKVALFKYLVANGKQNQVGRVPIDLAVQPDTEFSVRVDVRGPQFTTYIQGQQVDTWTDDQLKIGGAGFLNERDERGKVKSVSIRYLSGAGK